MSDAEVLDLTVDEIRSVLADAYGVIPDEVVVVGGEAATVCRIEAGQHRYAFKALRACGDVAAVLWWQSEAMVRLFGEGLPVPAVHPDTAGRMLHLSLLDGAPAVVQLSDWLDGPPLCAVDVDAEVCRQVGATAAAVSEALRRVPAPPVVVTHPWELTRTSECLRRALPGVADRHVRRLGADVAAEFETVLAPLLAHAPQVIVHHDMHDSNLLVGHDADGTPKVTGVLDFGDMVAGPRVAELAVAGAYVARNTADPARALLEVARGWCSVTSLTHAETAALLPAAIARLAVNACVWASRAHGSRAGYARLRSEATMPALEVLLAVDRAAFAHEASQLMRLPLQQRRPRDGFEVGPRFSLGPGQAGAVPSASGGEGGSVW